MESHENPIGVHPVGFFIYNCPKIVPKNLTLFIFLLTRTLRHVLSLPANNKSARIVMGKNKLKIGEFSRLGRVTVRALKSMGYSLEEIRDLWDDEQHFPTVESLEEKIRKCEDELAVLKERKRMLKAVVASQKKLHKMEKVYFESLPAITVASHRTIIPSFDDLGRLCYEVIGPEMARLGCECPEPGYCYTIEHGGYKPQDIDIEYCEKVTKKGTDSALIKFKDIPAVPLAACLKVFGSYDKLYDNYVELFAYLEKEGYKIADAPRAVYIDGIWNQEDADKWLTIIQVPVEKA